MIHIGFFLNYDLMPKHTSYKKTNKHGKGHIVNFC